MDVDILGWLGNFINFLILIFLVSVVVKTQCFDTLQLLISAFGLAVSIAISIYTSLINRY